MMRDLAAPAIVVWVALALGCGPLACQSQGDVRRTAATAPNFVLGGLRDSALVLAGRVLSVSSLPATILPPPRNAPPRPVLFEIDRVIEGDYNPRRISIDTRAMPFLGADSRGHYYVVFLVRLPGGAWGPLVNTISAFVPARPVDVPEGASPGTVVEDLIASAVGTRSAPANEAWVGPLFLEGDDSPNPVLTRAFERVRNSPDPRVRGAAIAGLVMRGAPGSLSAAESYLAGGYPGAGPGEVIKALAAAASPRSIQILSNAAVGAGSLRVRSYALEYLGQTRSPNSLATFKLALNDPSPSVRVAAITGLGQSWMPEAIPLLARALDDPDERIRLAAVHALGAIRYRIGWYNLDEHDFRAHEADYLRTWKQWARENSPPAVPH